MKELETLKSLYIEKRDVPFHLILHNTFICNAKCGHCFNWKNLNKHKPSEELSLEQFEKIAKSFNGVANTFAIQAGRELRVIVESEKITDEDATLLCRDVAKKIEESLTFPGQIKVMVIRETRAVEYANK